MDVSGDLGTAPVGEWRAYKVRLSCFADPRAEAIETPFVLSSGAAATISVSEIQLSPDVGPADCPGD